MICLVITISRGAIAPEGQLQQQSYRKPRRLRSLRQNLSQSVAVCLNRRTGNREPVKVQSLLRQFLAAPGPQTERSSSGSGSTMPRTTACVLLVALVFGFSLARSDAVTSMTSNLRGRR